MIGEPVINHSHNGLGFFGLPYLYVWVQNGSSHPTIGNCCDTLLGKQPMPDVSDYIEYLMYEVLVH